MTGIISQAMFMPERGCTPRLYPFLILASLPLHRSPIKVRNPASISGHRPDW
jgi:hypothetical protein